MFAHCFVSYTDVLLEFTLCVFVLSWSVSPVSQLVHWASQQQDQDEKMAGCVFPMGPESFQRFTPDSLAAIEQRIAQEEARRNKHYQEVTLVIIKPCENRVRG